MHSQSLPSRSASSRVVSIALVIGLHALAILALLAAFTPTLVHLKVPPPIITRILPPVESPANTAPANVGGPTLYNPPVANPRQPVIDVEQPPNGPTIDQPTIPAGQGTGAVVLSPPLAIAATHTIPNYPPVAARMGAEGSVRLVLDIDTTGRVTDAAVLNSSGYKMLDDAAVAWVLAHWRYRPALRGETPVPAHAEAIVTFRLDMR